MGVKSTVRLSRTDAENRYADLLMEHGNPRYYIFQALGRVEDHDLEDMMEKLNDQAKDGEGFENYRIIEEE